MLYQFASFGAAGGFLPLANYLITIGRRVFGATGKFSLATTAALIIAEGHAEHDLMEHWHPATRALRVNPYCHRTCPP